MIGVIDYGAGNLASLEAALGRLALPNRRLVAPDDVPGPWILPGVGHFESAVRALRQSGFWNVIRDEVTRGRPILGICLGLQLLSEGSEEAPGTPGLGLLKGRARRLGSGVKVPHVGWTKVVPCVGPHSDAEVTIELQPVCWLYFVHAYALDPNSECLATAEHGRTFTAIAATGRVLGLQAHPEKSGAAGLSLLGQLLVRLETLCN